MRAPCEQLAKYDIYGNNLSRFQWFMPMPMLMPMPVPMPMPMLMLRHNLRRRLAHGCKCNCLESVKRVCGPRG